MLTVTDLAVSYGAIKALRGISFTVSAGEILTLIGSNGAGKTTCLHALSGLLRKAGGHVEFQGEDISALPPERIVRLGLVQVPEGRRIFANLTVRENLETGAFLRRDRSGIRSDMERVCTLFPRLKERMRQYAGTLSGGEQQMLAMGRALMARPSLLLLDEPSMGLAPILVDEIFSIIREINREGVTVLLVEQNACKALSVANRACVLETGEIRQQGNARDLLHDDRVKQAYLGGS